MSFPSSGVYKIKNVETGTYLNLEGAGTAVGTSIIGFHDDGTAANLVLTLRISIEAVITVLTTLPTVASNYRRRYWNYYFPNQCR